MLQLRVGLSADDTDYADCFLGLRCDLAAISEEYYSEGRLTRTRKNRQFSVAGETHSLSVRFTFRGRCLFVCEKSICGAWFSGTCWFFECVFFWLEEVGLSRCEKAAENAAAWFSGLVVCLFIGGCTITGFYSTVTSIFRGWSSARLSTLAVSTPFATVALMVAVSACSGRSSETA